MAASTVVVVVAGVAAAVLAVVVDAAGVVFVKELSLSEGLFSNQGSHQGVLMVL
jgi:hypothetical protein